MKEYTSGNYDKTIPAFVFRQYYDATNKKLIPEKLESQYYGEKVLNPDEELMANMYLNNEENFLGDAYDEDMLNKRRANTGTSETVIPLKKQKGGFDFTSFGGIKEASDKKDKKVSASTSGPNKPAHDKSKVVSMKALTQKAEDRRQELILRKVDQKAQHLLEKFKHSNPLSAQLPEQERIRQRIRENFFYALVFGLEECKIRQQNNETEDMREHIVDISKLLMKDEKSQIEHIKNITLSIEANLYHKYNKEIGKSSAYINKSRVIFMSLKHKKNFDLRLRVLVDNISPSQLCFMTEEELAPNAVKCSRREEQERYMSGKMIEEEPTFISKSKKLELAVGAPIDNGLPPVSVDANMELNKEKIDENEVDDDEENYMPSGQGADSKINKEMKGIIDELNPKKLAEKAQQRYKTHLPAETASQLSKAMNF